MRLINNLPIIQLVLLTNTFIIKIKMIKIVGNVTLCRKLSENHILAEVRFFDNHASAVRTPNNWNISPQYYTLKQF